MPDVRPCVERVFEELKAKPHRPVVLQAPTGYGKSSGVVRLAPRLVGGVAARLVHVLPLRAIVEQVYLWAVEHLEPRGFSVGYQAMGLGLGGKSPFMAPDFTVSTYDSLLLNLYRGNVAEHHLGHYEVPRAHILSGLIVFDEAHLGLRGGLADSFYTGLASLHSMAVPLAVLTATLPPAALERVRSALGGDPSIYTVVPGEGCEGLPAGSRSCLDPSFYEPLLQLEWRYHCIGDSDDELVETVLGEASRGRRVFLAVKTPGRAIALYDRLRGELGAGSVALIHGRMPPVDRRSHLERLGDATVLVGTSAVEAGVDADFDVLVTEAVEPSSLIQRLGRVCRRPGRCREPVDVYIAGADKRLKTLCEHPLDPRLPCDYRGRRGYHRLLELEGGGGGGGVFDSTRYRLAATILTPSLVEELIENYCNLARDEPIIPVLPQELLDEVREGRLGLHDAVIPVSLSVLQRALRKRLPWRLSQCKDGGGLELIAVAADGSLQVLCEKRLESIIGRGDCKRLTEILSKPLGEGYIPVALVAKGYRRGLGLG